MYDLDFDCLVLIDFDTLVFNPSEDYKTAELKMLDNLINTFK